jgi:hypothetical protein
MDKLIRKMIIYYPINVVATDTARLALGAKPSAPIESA